MGTYPPRDRYGACRICTAGCRCSALLSQSSPTPAKPPQAGPVLNSPIAKRTSLRNSSVTIGPQGMSSRERKENKIKLNWSGTKRIVKRFAVGWRYFQFGLVPAGSRQADKGARVRRGLR
jgi:hypothetical protein